MRRSEAPVARAASTSWLELCPSTMERIVIVRPGHEKATSTSRISHSCAPSTKTMKISSGSSGTLLTTSAARCTSRSVRPPRKPDSSPSAVPMSGGDDGRRDADQQRDRQAEEQALRQVAALRVGAHQAVDAAAEHGTDRRDLVRRVRGRDPRLERVLALQRREAAVAVRDAEERRLRVPLEVARARP